MPNENCSPCFSLPVTILRGCHVGRLLCLWFVLHFLGAPSSCLGADISIPGRWGYAVTETTYQGQCILFYNQGTSPVTLNCTARSVSYSPAFTGTGSISLTNGGTITGTIPAGTYRFVPLSWSFLIQNAADIGTKNLTLSVTYNLGSGSSTFTSPARSCLFVSQATQPTSYSITSSNALRPPTNTPQLNSPGTVFSNGDYVAWATITVGTVPPLGHVKVTGLKGNYNAKLKIDGNVVATADQVPTPPTDASAPGPPLEWSTITPANYVGKKLELVVNGMLCYLDKTIDADVNGNFDYLLEFDWEFTQRITSAETEVPLPGDKPIDPYGEIDESHTRPEPGTIPGTDPKTDTAAPTSVKDYYRATRAAIEDALGGNGAPGNFNFDEWRNGDLIGQSGTAFNAGASLGDTIGTIATGQLPGGFGTGIGQNAIYPIETAWGTVTLGLPSWAGIIRGVFLVVASFYFWRAMVHTIRGAFTTTS